MARLPRIVIPGQPLHIMHRGNNRQEIFESEEDMSRILYDISISLEKERCSLHAYVIMTNHIHFLLTPHDETALSRFMQSVANRYVRYFNADRKRTGTIWEGRFKSCLVDSERYLLSVYRYIERNPLRAGMVKSITSYPWSSYHHNAMGIEDKLITEHDLYRRLGKNADQRRVSYQQLFSESINQQEDEAIDLATMKGEVFGSAAFHEKVAKVVGRATKLGSHGGDRKSSEWEGQAG